MDLGLQNGTKTILKTTPRDLQEPLGTHMRFTSLFDFHVGPFWASNMDPTWALKSVKKTLQHRPGHPKGRQETPEASGTPFWTLQATIFDPPGVDLGPPGG